MGSRVFDTVSLICRSIKGAVLDVKVRAICAETSGRKRTRSISAGMLCDKDILSMYVLMNAEGARHLFDAVRYPSRDLVT